MAFGRKLAEELRPPCLVLLEGELGSGKTTLAKGIVAGLGAAREEDVTSPSFTFVREYGRENKVYHVDLYRIEDARALGTLGLEDLFNERAVIIVEWGDKLEGIRGLPKVRVQMEHAENEARRIRIEGLKVGREFRVKIRESGPGSKPPGGRSSGGNS